MLNQGSSNHQNGSLPKLFNTIKQHPVLCFLLTIIIMYIIYIFASKTFHQVPARPDLFGKPVDGWTSSDVVSVYLIRHGKSTNNLLKEDSILGPLSYVEDPNLSADGWEQATELRNMLDESNFLENRDIGEIDSSLMRRAVQTTLAVFARFDLVVGAIVERKTSFIPYTPNGKFNLRNDFTEQGSSIGDKGRPIDQIFTMDRYPKHMANYFAYDPNEKNIGMPVGMMGIPWESHNDLAVRVQKFASLLKARLPKSGQNVVLVGHSHFWREFGNQILGSNPVKLENCGMAKVTFYDGKFVNYEPYDPKST
eukprot:686071_1